MYIEYKLSTLYIVECMWYQDQNEQVQSNISEKTDFETFFGVFKHFKDHLSLENFIRQWYNCDYLKVVNQLVL